MAGGARMRYRVSTGLTKSDRRRLCLQLPKGGWVQVQVHTTSKLDRRRKTAVHHVKPHISQENNASNQTKPTALEVRLLVFFRVLEWATVYAADRMGGRRGGDNGLCRWESEQLIAAARCERRQQVQRRHQTFATRCGAIQQKVEAASCKRELWFVWWTEAC